VHHAKQTLLVTAKYAEQLLGQAGNQDAERIAKALVETFPTHGYVISCEEGKALGLPIFPLDDYEFASEVKEAYRLTEGRGGVIHFCSLDEAIESPSEAQAPKASVRRSTKAKGGGSNGRAKNRRIPKAKSNGTGSRAKSAK
jgi:hypothetical protein